MYVCNSNIFYSFKFLLRYSHYALSFFCLFPLVQDVVTCPVVHYTLAPAHALCVFLRCVAAVLCVCLCAYFAKCIFVALCAVCRCSVQVCSMPPWLRGACVPPRCACVSALYCRRGLFAPATCVSIYPRAVFTAAMCVLLFCAVCLSVTQRHYLCPCIIAIFALALSLPLHYSYFCLCAIFALALSLPLDCECCVSLHCKSRQCIYVPALCVRPCTLCRCFLRVFALCRSDVFASASNAVYVYRAPSLRYVSPCTVLVYVCVDPCTVCVSVLCYIPLCPVRSSACIHFTSRGLFCVCSCAVCVSML